VFCLSKIRRKKLEQKKFVRFFSIIWKIDLHLVQQNRKIIYESIHRQTSGGDDPQGQIPD
jgi:hypothetical protein